MRPLASITLTPSGTTRFSPTCLPRIRCAKTDELMKGKRKPNYGGVKIMEKICHGKIHMGMQKGWEDGKEHKKKGRAKKCRKQPVQCLKQHAHTMSPKYALDEPVFNVDICIERLVIINNSPSFDQQPFTLQGKSTEREIREGEVELSPDILIYCTISYVIHGFIAI